MDEKGKHSDFQNILFNKFVAYLLNMFVISYFQEGAESISVWKLENRTTCAVEAINGVIGRGIPGNSNFFNFVHYLQRFELSRSIKFRNLYARCLIKKRRTKSTENSALIRNASELLEAGKITVNEFLDSIAKMKTKQYSREITTKKRGAISSDDTDADDEEPSTSQATTTHKSNSKRARTDCNNLCRMCACRESDVILLPCAHAVICSECWAKKLVQNDKFCVLCYESVTIAKKF